MNIVNKLTVRHLLQNRSRTLVTIMGIMLSVAMVCAVAGFVMSLRQVLRETIIDSRGDYHISYLGVTEETAASIAAEDVFSASYTKDSEKEGLTDIFLRLSKPGRNYWEVCEAIGKSYTYDTMRANTELLALDGVIAQDNVVKTFFYIGVIATVIIVAGSVIVISNAFYISSTERVRQFGLLKSAGATKWQIGRSILFEAVLLSAIAIPLGTALGFLIQAVVLQLVNGLLTELNQMNGQSITFHVVFSPVVIYISVGITLLTVFVSAWLPARRAANTSPIDAIRQTKDIKIRSKQLKTSRLTGKLFGFEGTLASKSLKRSRGKYRATVVSLTASIVIFVSVSSFIGTMNKGVQMEYGGYDLDVLISTTGNLEKIDDMNRILVAIPNAEVKTSRRTAFETLTPDGFFTKNAQNSLTDQNMYGLLLFSMPDAEFSQLVPEARGGIDGILINTTGSFHQDGKSVEYIPYNFQAGMELPLTGKNRGGERISSGSITIVAAMEKIPDSMLAPLFEGNCINILVSDSVYRNLYRADNSFIDFYVKADKPDAFCEVAENLLLPFGETFSIWNVAQMTRLNRNIVLIISLFGYGFIAMLSLIAVTSVITTISTGMALRRQEFAMLYSAGMTPGGMNKMLNMESLLYGLKSIVIGLPVGVALSYLIYLSTSGIAEFAYIPPYYAMAASSAAVLLLAFGTMRYSRGKMRSISIVDALRSETA